jgi:ketosteroid isomerase-like protein
VSVVPDPTTAPVRSLDDFFGAYLAVLEAGDAAGLGDLYEDHAVLTSTGGPGGDTWAVGRDQIVAMFQQTLATVTIDDEVPPTSPYERRGDNLAARFGIFHSTVTDKQTGQTVHLTVEAVELLARSETMGWRYIADQTRIISVTTPAGAPT